jgi:conjugative transfer signal peptidase TraF
MLGRFSNLVLFTVGPLIVVVAMGAAGMRFNATPSVPIGLYWISSDPQAKFVEFCPPLPYASSSVERGYRARSSRGCSDGGVPLLKSIIARPGDIVELSARGFSVNRIPIPNTAPRSVDTAGRVLTPWPFGSYRVAPGTMWVASSYNSRSFDSRYFGPIAAATIKHRLRPIWTE